jgi:hypothetical protein
MPTVSLLIEPVRAVVELKGRDNARVVALDHGGRNTTQPVPVEFTDDGIRVVLDGAKTKAVHDVPVTVASGTGVSETASKPLRVAGLESCHAFRRIVMLEPHQTAAVDLQYLLTAVFEQSKHE